MEDVSNRVDADPNLTDTASKMFPIDENYCNGNIFQSQYDNEANIVNRSSIVLIFAFYSYLGIRRHINGIQSQIWT